MLISILVDNQFHSSKQLCESLGINHIEISVYVQMLRNWGLIIPFIHGKGYVLSTPIQLLDKNVIMRHIKNAKVIFLPVIDSTNQYLLDHIGELNSGDICIAEYQQAGRGRCGRKWISSFGNNLYLSMFWCFQKGIVATVGLSLAISIVVAEVLQKFGIKKVRIKWPNDLYIYDRKLAGILVEINGKTHGVAQIVIGLGLNMVIQRTQINFFNQSWISLQEVGFLLDRNILAIHLINALRESITFFEKKGLKPFLEKWRKLDNFVNRPVKLIIGNKEIYGISRGINEHGSLLLEQENIVKTWSSGEISLRVIK